MNLINEKSFENACGKMIPPRRNMDTFNGDKFKCSCGSEHTFNTNYISVLSEGFNGRFVVACPDNHQLICLIKTKMSFGIIYKGLEFIAGHKINES